LKFYEPVGVYKIRDATDEQVKTMIEGGLRRDPQMPDVFRGTPSFEHYAKIMSYEPATYRPSDLECSPDAVTAYLFMLKGMAIFATLSHTFYHSDGGIAMFGQGIAGKGELVLEYGATQDKVVIPLDAQGWMMARTTKLNPIAVPTDTSRNFRRGYNSIRNTTALPTTSGLFFPYFEGQMLPDKMFAYTVFARIFPQLLTNRPDLLPLMLMRLKNGYAALSSKTSGMALSHAYLGINLAVQGHATINFLITRGVYQGFVLGGDYKLALYKEVFNPIPADDVIESFKLLTSHETAFNKLKIHIEQKKFIDGSIMFPCDVESLNTSRRLLRYLKTISYDDFKDIPDWNKDADRLIDQLDFEGEEFLPISITTVTTFLTYVETGDETLLDNTPAFLRGGYYRSCVNNKVATGLGLFGPGAPSCNFGGKSNNMTFNIPKVGTADTNLVKDPNTNQAPLRYLPFQKMHPASALSQWVTLFADGILRLPVGDKKRGQFCNMSGVVLHIHNETPLAHVYTMIRNISSTTRSTTGSKRKAATTETRGGNAKKSRSAKDKEVDAMF